MRPLDIATIEPFVREALPLATDAEIAAILVRLGGRIVRPEEQARVQPGQGLGARTNAALLRGFLSHAISGRPARGDWDDAVGSHVRRLVDVPAAREAAGNVP